MKAREPKQGKVEEIPTPEVWPVASYEADYRPVFRPPPSYLRGACRGVAGARWCSHTAHNADSRVRHAQPASRRTPSSWSTTSTTKTRTGWCSSTARRTGCQRSGAPRTHGMGACMSRPRADSRGRFMRTQTRSFEMMLWKLELACDAAQAQVRAHRGVTRAAWSTASHAAAFLCHVQALLEMQTLATERSLPPPSYADKARRLCADAYGNAAR